MKWLRVSFQPPNLGELQPRELRDLTNEMMTELLFTSSGWEIGKDKQAWKTEMTKWKAILKRGKEIAFTYYGWMTLTLIFRDGQECTLRIIYAFLENGAGAPSPEYGFKRKQWSETKLFFLIMLLDLL